MSLVWICLLSCSRVSRWQASFFSRIPSSKQSSSCEACTYDSIDSSDQGFSDQRYSFRQRPRLPSMVVNLSPSTPFTIYSRKPLTSICSYCSSLSIVTRNQRYRGSTCWLGLSISFLRPAPISVSSFQQALTTKQPTITEQRFMQRSSTSVPSFTTALIFLWEFRKWSSAASFCGLFCSTKAGLFDRQSCWVGCCWLGVVNVVLREQLLLSSGVFFCGERFFCGGLPPSWLWTSCQFWMVRLVALRQFELCVDRSLPPVQVVLLFEVEEKAVEVFFDSDSSAVILYSNSSDHSIRRCGSLTSIRFSSFSRLGLPVLGMLASVESSTWMSFAMEPDLYGHSPVSISQSTTPSDQISAFMVQISPLSTSGAMQSGEPSIVSASPCGLVRLLQKPKSAILMIPLCSRMLSGLRSRCMMFSLVRVRNASTICLKQQMALASGITFSGELRNCCMSFSRVPPLQYSYTKQKLLTVLSMSMQRIMCGLSSILERALISLTVHSSSLGTSLNFSALITLMATSSFVLMFTPRYTLPYTPCPSTSCKEQFSIILPIRSIINHQPTPSFYCLDGGFVFLLRCSGDKNDLVLSQMSAFAGASNPQPPFPFYVRFKQQD